MFVNYEWYFTPNLLEHFSLESLFHLFSLKHLLVLNRLWRGGGGGVELFKNSCHLIFKIKDICSDVWFKDFIKDRKIHTR